MYKKNLKNEFGFTLIEVLISVAILSVMALIMFATVSGALKSKERLVFRDELFQGVRVGLNIINEDMSMGFLANKELSGKNTETGFKGGKETIILSTFSNFHFIRNSKDSDQVTVGYRVKDDGRGGQSLVRSQTLWVHEKLEPKGNAYVLLENIKDLKFEYYDSNRKEWVSDWDSGGLTSAKRLPQAIKVSFSAIEYENPESEEILREYPFSTIIKIPLYKDALKF